MVASYPTEYWYSPRGVQANTLGIFSSLTDDVFRQMAVVVLRNGTMAHPMQATSSSVGNHTIFTYTSTVVLNRSALYRAPLFRSVHNTTINHEAQVAPHGLFNTSKKKCICRLSETDHIYKAHTCKPNGDTAHYTFGIVPIVQGLQRCIVHDLEVLRIEHQT